MMMMIEQTLNTSIKYFFVHFRIKKDLFLSSRSGFQYHRWQLQYHFPQPSRGFQSARQHRYHQSSNTCLFCQPLLPVPAPRPDHDFCPGQNQQRHQPTQTPNRFPVRPMLGASWYHPLLPQTVTARRKIPYQGLPSGITDTWRRRKRLVFLFASTLGSGPTRPTPAISAANFGLQRHTSSTMVTGTAQRKPQWTLRLGDPKRRSAGRQKRRRSKWRTYIMTRTQSELFLETTGLFGFMWFFCEIYSEFWI